MRICRFVLPFTSALVGYTAFSSVNLFSSVHEHAIEASVLASSIALQSIFIYMAVREATITTYDWFRGRSFDYGFRFGRYFFICCIDGCLILAMTIWSTVA